MEVQFNRDGSTCVGSSPTKKKEEAGEREEARKSRRKQEHAGLMQEKACRQNQD